MMEAVVLDCKGNKATVLAKDGTFRTIADAAYTVGQRIELAEGAKAKTGGRRFAAVSAAACALLAVGLGAGVWFTPCAHVDVEAGHTVSLTVNRFDYVIDVNVEQDTQEVLSEELLGALESCKVTEATARIIGDAPAGAVVDVTVASDRRAKRERLQEVIDGELAKRAQDTKSVQETKNAQAKEPDGENERSGVKAGAPTRRIALAAAEKPTADAPAGDDAADATVTDGNAEDTAPAAVDAAVTDKTAENGASTDTAAVDAAVTDETVENDTVADTAAADTAVTDETVGNEASADTAIADEPAGDDAVSGVETTAKNGEWNE